MRAKHTTRDALKKVMARAEWEFPDTSYKSPGATQRETIQAMRAAKGDRRAAALALGIHLGTLAARLQQIRNMRDALECNEKA